MLHIPDSEETGDQLQALFPTCSLDERSLWISWKEGLFQLDPSNLSLTSIGISNE